MTSKIRKDGLGSKRGYSSWKPAKGGSGRGDYCMKIVRTNGQMRNSESKCLRKAKIVENNDLQEKKPRN